METNQSSWRRLTVFTRQAIASSPLGRLGLLCALTLAVGFVVPSAHAQAGTGNVSGRVLNVGNSKYVANAVVTVDGGNREALTNDYGEYRLTDVPAGEVKIRVVSGGLDPEVAAVTVVAGQTATRDFELTSAERYGQDKTVQLDTFVVAANREFEGNAIATNEQRFAKGLKVVMAADAFGDVTEGNAGEFLKFLPGVSVDYVAADVRTVSVRGFASNFTNVFLDGMPITSSNSGASGRTFEFEQLSINNASRVEVLKVPTPDTPASGIGGNVNMVSKSSLERKGAQFNYRAYFSLNNEDLNFRKTPGPDSATHYKALPGFDFDYTLPVNKSFGLVITGLSSNQFNEQHRSQTLWNFAQAGATLANPYLNSGQLQDGPKVTHRESVSVKGDWKITENQLLSVMVQDSYYKSFFGNRNLNANVGTTATTTAAGGTALQWGPTFSQAPTGNVTAAAPYGDRGQVTQGSSFRDKLGNTAAFNARYAFNANLWNVEGGIHGAKSRTWYRALDRDHFANVGTRLVGVANLRIENVAFPNYNFVARDTSGAAINQYDLANYRLTTASDDPIDGVAKLAGAYLDVKRDMEIGKIPFSIKAGGRIYEESKDNRRRAASYTFVGADGVANTADDSAAPYLDTVYAGQDPYWSSPSIQWVNAFKLAQTLKSNPSYFTTNDVTTELNRITNSEKITETISAYYVQLEGKFLNNRLNVITGVRYEKTRDQGEGMLTDPDIVWQRNANGTFVDGSTAAGLQRVLRTDIGALNANGTANSVQAVRVINQERGARPDRSYDDYYPSLNFQYNITENLLLRVGYAVTMGRPDYTNIIPRTVVDDNENFDLDPTVSPGSLTIRNTKLKPWKADNYDVSLEYYFDKGGVFTAGAFQKNIDGFFETRSGAVDAALANELGIGPEFIGWQVATTVNGASSSTIKGLEFSFNRQLSFLPGWGRYLSINLNGTSLQLEGPNATAFSNFIRKTGNFTLSWNKKPLSAKLNLNYRGRQLRSAQTGAQYGATNGFNEYYQSRVTLDANVEYTLSKRLKLFASARNILNVPQILERSVAGIPAYSLNYQQEEFGIQMAVGIKGTY